VRAVIVDPATSAFYRWIQRQHPAKWQAASDGAARSAPGAAAQLKAFPTTLEEVDRLSSFPKVPVIVLSATKLQPPFFDSDVREHLTRMQIALAQKFGSRFVRAEACGHARHRHRRDDRRFDIQRTVQVYLYSVRPGRCSGSGHERRAIILAVHNLHRAGMIDKRVNVAACVASRKNDEAQFLPALGGKPISLRGDFVGITGLVPVAALEHSGLLRLVRNSLRTWFRT
jgi:hypothetical protein